MKEESVLLPRPPYSYNSIPTKQEDEDTDENTIHNHKGTIGMFGSISIIVNTSIGPAMLNLPATFQKAGFFPTTFTILSVSYLALMCGLHLANTISKIEGNSNFSQEIEYSDAFYKLMVTPQLQSSSKDIEIKREEKRRRWFATSHIFFFLCIFCLNMASIVDTAQVVDSFFSTLSSSNKNSFALSIFPHTGSILRWSSDECYDNDSVNETDLSDPSDVACEPFENTSDMIITAGYFISAVVFLPIGFLDLKENIPFQNFSLAFLILTSIIFIILFLCSDQFDPNNMPLFGDDWDDLLGIILFNFTAVTSIPAYLYEKNPNVNVTKVMNHSMVLASSLYIVVGALGAMAVPSISENMLSTMINSNGGSSGIFSSPDDNFTRHMITFTQYSAIFFCFVEIGFGIPLFSVLSRLNLTNSGLCNRFWGGILGNLLPWSLGWIFYNSKTSTGLLNWGGILFTSVVVFIAPLVLALRNTGTKGHIKVWSNFLGSKIEHDETKEYMAISFLLVISAFAVSVSIANNIIHQSSE